MAGSKQKDATTGRSGRYITQPNGYRAFIPVSLPPNPPIRLQGELQSLLSTALPFPAISIPIPYPNPTGQRPTPCQPRASAAPPWVQSPPPFSPKG